MNQSWWPTWKLFTFRCSKRLCKNMERSSLENQIWKGSKWASDEFSQKWPNAKLAKCLIFFLVFLWCSELINEWMFSNIAYQAIMVGCHSPHLMENWFKCIWAYACILLDFCFFIFLIFSFPLVCWFLNLWLLILGFGDGLQPIYTINTHRYYAWQYAKKKCK